MNEIADLIDKEVLRAKTEHSFLVGEYLEAQNKKAKANAWKRAADDCKSRIERLEAIATKAREAK